MAKLKFQGLRNLKDCEKCVLEGGLERVVLDIAPTMKNIKRDGHVYYRCTNTRSIVDGVEQAMYLYEKWPEKPGEPIPAAGG